MLNTIITDGIRSINSSVNGMINVNILHYSCSVLYLMGFGCLGHKASSMEVDEQPGGERLLLCPAHPGQGDGGRIAP